MERSLQFILGVVVALALVVLSMAGPGSNVLRAERSSLPVYVFWQEGCPYCTQAKAELRTLSGSDPKIQLHEIEIGVAEGENALFEKVMSNFGYDQAAVPLVVIGDRSFLGFFSGGRSADLYRQAAEQCLRKICPDVVAQLTKGLKPVGKIAGPADPSPDKQVAEQALPQTIRLPLLGDVKSGDLSLPALTILLAAVDGFNPCAMWVLVFLIGLLLGLKDERRMWLLGAAFLGATAIMYFAVMAAWLNLILFLGVVFWVRAAIGVLAIGGGVYFLREYWTQPIDACRVTNPGRRQKIMDAFRSVVNSNQLMLSVIGIMMLAVVVNLIELLCSAGIPAVYTQVLALSDLPVASYYAYLCLYITVFMLDDVAIFATAMLALRIAGLTGTYVRFSHLIGGIVLVAIGAVLLLRPELLTFS